MPRIGKTAHDEEYDEFVAVSWRRLCWTAYMLTGDRQLAEDLAQNHRFQPTVVGGMHGTRTTRVVLTLRDGSTTNATLDTGRISRGDSVFWALLDSPPVKATAYDRHGHVVEDHRLTPCDDPVDCSTR